MARVRGFLTLNGANTQLASEAVEFATSTSYRQFVVDFDLLGGTTLYAAVSGVSRNAATDISLKIRVGGTTDTADGTTAVSVTHTNAAAFTDYNISGSGTMAMPTGVQLVKINYTNAVSVAFNAWVIYLEGRT